MGNARASLVMRGGLQAEAVITPATAFTKARPAPPSRQERKPGYSRISLLSPTLKLTQAVAGERTSGQWVTCTFGRSLGAAVTFNTVKRAGKFLRRDPGYEQIGRAHV